MHFRGHEDLRSRHATFEAAAAASAAAPQARRERLVLPALRRAHGSVLLPGSKSVSIRVLLLAALSEGETRLVGLLDSDDTRVMRDALATLGVPMRWENRRGAGGANETTLVVSGARAFPAREANLFVGNSGLSIRTLAAALAFSGGRYRLEGVPRMHERPIGDLVDALVALGAVIEYERSPGYPPIRIVPQALKAAELAASGEGKGGEATEGGQDVPLEVSVRASASSQFLTGVLQAAPLLAAETAVTIAVEGGLISRPYVDLTLALMARFGVAVAEPAANRFTIARGAHFVGPGDFRVEGDASSASYFLAAAALGGGPVRVTGMGTSTLQGDARFVAALAKMGVAIEQGENWTEARSPGVASGFRLHAIDGDFNHIPDAAMTIALLALFADGPSTLRNIGSWRVKETDRLGAMATELRKFGAGVEAGTDTIHIVPPPAAIGAPQPLGPIEVDTYDDHRIAMCFSLAAFGGRAVQINDPDCVAKTFPDYFDRYLELVS